jgi:hypothetical protein
VEPRVGPVCRWEEGRAGGGRVAGLSSVLMGLAVRRHEELPRQKP